MKMMYHEQFMVKIRQSFFYLFEWNMMQKLVMKWMLN